MLADFRSTRKGADGSRVTQQNCRPIAKLGPLQTMLPAQVAESYDQIATAWASPSFDQNNGIEQHKRAIGFMSHRGTALDVGCGCNGRLIDLLLSQGFAAEGLDLSSEMLRLAREVHPQVTLHHADICDWSPPKTYDFI